MPLVFLWRSLRIGLVHSQAQKALVTRAIAAQKNVPRNLRLTEEEARTLVGADSRDDIALLKINPNHKTIARLLLGDLTGLQVGQSVLAIENPFGFSGTLRKGVISAL
jgi:S1-C subfamily serine protease